MMNGDEGFQQRWEMRGLKVDGDTSSDDERSNARGEATEKQPNTVTDLVLYGSGEASDYPVIQRHGDGEKVDDTIIGLNIVSETVKAADETKTKSSLRKKKVQVQKKLPAAAAKETKKKRKHSLNWNAMMKDLKMFGESLVHELAAERENMFAHMRDEMKKLAAAASKQKMGVMMNRNVRQRMNHMNVASTSEMPPRNNVSKAVADAMKLASELQYSERLRQSTIAALPTSFPSLLHHHHQQQQQQLQQNQMNRMMMNNRPPCMNNNNSSSEMYNLMAARSLSRRVAEFQQQQQQQYGGFSIKYHRNWGVYGESQGMQNTGSSYRPSMPLFMNGSGTAGSPSTNQAPLLGMNMNMTTTSIRVPRTTTDGEFLAARTTQGQRDVRSFNMSNSNTN